MNDDYDEIIDDAMERALEAVAATPETDIQREVMNDAESNAAEK